MRVFGRNTLWLLLDRAGLKVGSMLAGLLLVGYLGPANVGVYSTAIAAGCVLNAMFDIGLTRYAARAVAADPREAPAILALSLASTIAATVLEVFAAMAAHLSGNWYWTCLFVGFIFTNFDGTASACAGILSADLRSRDVLPGSVLNALGVIGIIALVVRLRLSVLALLTGLALKSVAVLLFRLWQLRGFWPASWSYFAPRGFVQLARRSWAFFSYSLTQMGYEKAAIVSFGLVATRESVGLLSTALLIAGIFPSFTYAASDAVLPVMTRLYEDGRTRDLLELRQRLLDLLLYLSVPVVVVLAMFAPEVCTLLGARFAGSAVALRIVAARSVLSVLDNFLGQAGLTAAARVRERRNAQAVGLALCILLTIPLGMRWGAAGAAVVTLLADIVIVTQYFLIFRRIGLPVARPPLGPLLAASCAMAAAPCLMSSKGSWFAAACAATLLYSAVLAAAAPRRFSETVTTFRQCFVPKAVLERRIGTAT